jgi:phosphomannomutase
MNDGLMISVSGIRGIFGVSLTPEVVLKYSAHFGIYCQNSRKERNSFSQFNEFDKTIIVIGRDSRTTGKTLCYAVRSALMGVGCDVIDLGMVSTPTLLLAVKELKADGGICITASHNPSHWNALKLCSHKGMFLFPEDAQRFLESTDRSIHYADWDRQGKAIYNLEATNNHIEKILSIPYVDFDSIRQKRVKVVIDSVNGAGGLISPVLLKRLNCEVIEINSEATGYFAHKPEPLSENLSQIKEAVIHNKADLGFATDPDVDRLSVISEQGETIGEELSLVLAAKYVLSIKRGDIVTNCSTTMAIDDIAAAFGVQVHRTKVGEINVGKKMLEINSPIGGEGNGGIILPEVNYTRDAPVGMVLILALLAQEDKPLSEIVRQIPKYYITKDKIEAKSEFLDDALKKAEQIYAHEKIDKTDGLKIIGDKYWIHIRKSGTEPIMRIYVESDSQNRSDMLCKEVKNNINPTN